MIDPGNQQPVRVLLDAKSTPYIRLTVLALDQVRQVLQDNGIPFQVDPYTVSIDRKPAVAWIRIHKKSDPGQVQIVLDSVA